MAERYIRRTLLPAQRFALGCPVVLTAGALLEDTQQPRLVGQLKWTAPRSAVTALTIALCCQEKEPQELTFRYQELHTIPGVPFGQYTAIPLPAGTTAFQVEVEEVVLQNGTVWSRRVEQEKRQAAQRTTTQAAAQAAETASVKADVVPENRPKTAAVKPPVHGKALAILAAALVVVIAAGVLLLPRLGRKPDQTPPAEMNAPAAGDSALSAADDTTPKPSPTPQPAASSPTLSPVFSSVDLGETGETATVYIPRDESGYFPLTPDAFLDALPNASTTCARMGKDLGGDVIAYLKDSFSFAWYITQDSPEYGMFGDGTMYPPSKGSLPPVVCVLALSGQDHGKLVGYFIGLPEQVDQDTLRIDLTLCDYPLEPLYEQERAAFLAGADLLDVERVAPDTDFEALGVEYCLPGFYTSETDHLTQYDCQRYHLWQALTSEDPRRYARSVESMQAHMANSGHQEHYMFHLLLDQDCQPIAYTWQN